LVVAGIYLFHDSLQQVIVVQLVLMVLLLIVVARPFFRSRKTVASSWQEAA
jgi:hypothetical protein